MASPRGTDGHLLASLPWTLAALAFAIAPHVPFLPWWITAAFFICGAWRYLIEKRRRPLPSTWFRALLALVCFLGVLGTYSTISGVGPGSALLAVMASLKLLETRKRRDQFVSLFICIFLIMSSLLREQYLWSLPYLVVGVIMTMTAWLRVSAAAVERPPQSFATSSRLVLYAAPLAVAMWVFFPRIATPFWAVPMDTGTATSGISDQMSPGDISDLSMSDAVAFRVKFDGDLPEPRDRYWRGLVLTLFNGRTWTGNDPVEGVRAYEKVVTSGRPVDYEVTIEPTRQPWVFALDMPWEWDDRRIFMGPQQQLARSRPIDQRRSYRVTSYLDYRTDVDLDERAMEFYLRMPDGTNTETRAFARRLRAESASDGDFIEAVLTHFHEQEFYYTLEPPPLGSNPVDRFMFDTRQGFCEHYASAFGVLMRAAGIPSRVVLGYQGGEVNTIGGHMLVRQSDAHAWNEVWLEGVGWRRVDPTAAVAPERIEWGRSASMFDGVGNLWGLSAPSLWMYEVEMYLDALNAYWNEWVLGYGPDNQNRFMEWLGMDDPDWRKMMLTLVAVVIAIVVLISLLLAWRYKPPQPDRAAVLYRKFVRKSGVPARIGETPAFYADRLLANSDIAPDKIETITDYYLAARYGPDDPAALQNLQRAVSSLS